MRRYPQAVGATVKKDKKHVFFNLPRRIWADRVFDNVSIQTAFAYELLIGMIVSVHAAIAAHGLPAGTAICPRWHASVLHLVL